jgi:hypothetical protein
MNERNKIWKQAQAERKKYVQILTLAKGAPVTCQQFTETFKKSAVRDFAGKAKVSHRAILFSADLMWESDVEPWFKFENPVEADMQPW